MLYGLLLDRMGLSVHSGWLDSARRVYIYFTLEDAMVQMNCGHNKAVKLFADLEQIGLIECRKQGQGKPTKIYVKNFILPPAPEPPTPNITQPHGEVLTSEKGKSALPQTGSQDFPKANANKAELNQTELSDTDPSIPPPLPTGQLPRQRRKRRWIGMDVMDSYRELVKENISYDLLMAEHPLAADLLEGYLELIVEVCCSRLEYIRIGDQNQPAEVVKSCFQKLDKEQSAMFWKACKRIQRWSKT